MVCVRWASISPNLTNVVLFHLRTWHPEYEYLGPNVLSRIMSRPTNTTLIARLAQLNRVR